MSSGYVAGVAPDIPGRLLALLLAVLVVGCGDDQGEPATTTTTTAPGATGDASAPSALRPPPCPPADNCARAAGEIAFVERVDPDGDGDAHFVLLSRESITAPGISVIDVRAELRPRPLPGPGDQLAASGPVFEGSFGQRQIQADTIRFRRVGG